MRVEASNLVDPAATRLLRQLQPHFGVVPIMLVAFQSFDLVGATAFAEFPAPEYLAELVEWNDVEVIDWEPLPELVEAELPF